MWPSHETPVPEDLGGGAWAAMLVLGSSCTHRRSVACSPASHLPCGPVPDRHRSAPRDRGPDFD